MSAAQNTHLPCELTLVEANDIEETVTFASKSASRPGHVHYTTLATQTGETLCTCRAAECGQRCWHVALVRLAWARDTMRAAIATYADDELATAAKWAASRLRSYRARKTYALPLADRVTMVACREEWVLRSQNLWANIEPEDAA